MVAWCGEDKLLAGTSRPDVEFHAHRAVQELHYDTLKSCKSQEIEVCPSLKMPLPHDYVNYVKLVWVDKGGIEHVIYPMAKSSNPFAIEQDDCEYTFGEECFDQGHTYNSNTTLFVLNQGSIYTNSVDESGGFSCGPGYTAKTVGEGENSYVVCCANIGDDLVEQVPSNTWDNYSTSGGLNEPAPAESDTDIYDAHIGQRFGLDPQFTQKNGWFYIDCLRHNIHFSSGFVGQTIILKYISDGLEDEHGLIIHKFAEEAMYQWMAYTIASTKAGVQEFTIGRLRQNKIAATRRAKIRLSNVKLEEISQVFRGKSKIIKH